MTNQSPSSKEGLGEVLTSLVFNVNGDFMEVGTISNSYII